MSEPVPIYLWRAPFQGNGSDTVISVAPAEAVTAVYGGGGIYDTEGLRAAFDGSVVFCNPETRAMFLGVWGARKASRFRSELRLSGAHVEILRHAPPAVMAVWSTRSKMSRRQKRAKVESIS